MFVGSYEEPRTGLVVRCIFTVWHVVVTSSIQSMALLLSWHFAHSTSRLPRLVVYSTVQYSTVFCSENRRRVYHRLRRYCCAKCALYSKLFRPQSVFFAPSCFDLWQTHFFIKQAGPLQQYGYRWQFFGVTHPRSTMFTGFVSPPLESQVKSLFYYSSARIGSARVLLCCAVGMDGPVERCRFDTRSTPRPWTSGAWGCSSTSSPTGRLHSKVCAYVLRDARPFSCATVLPTPLNEFALVIFSCCHQAQLFVTYRSSNFPPSVSRFCVAIGVPACWQLHSCLSGLCGFACLLVPVHSFSPPFCLRRASRQG